MKLAAFPKVINEYICALALKIRFAKEPNSPNLISHWLELDCCRETDPSAQRAHFERQFRLLLDAIADELLPSHWRRSCLDNVNRPLIELEKLSSSSEHRIYVK